MKGKFQLPTFAGGGRLAPDGHYTKMLTGTVQYIYLVWHEDQKAVRRRLAAILSLANNSNQDASS